MEGTATNRKDVHKLTGGEAELKDSEYVAICIKKNTVTKGKEKKPEYIY
jgi:hypothetical protein